MLRKECPASLFEREAEVLCGALKTKSCLSVSEFFLFSVEKCRSSSKSADGSLSFLLKVRITPTKTIKLQQYIRTAVYKKDAW